MTTIFQRFHATSAKFGRVLGEKSLTTVSSRKITLSDLSTQKTTKIDIFRKNDQNRPKIDDSKLVITFVFHR